MISQEDIQQLNEIYEEEFGEKIDNRIIVECGQVLVDLLSAVYKSNKISNLEE